jgi:hypothetical protein
MKDAAFQIYATTDPMMVKDMGRIWSAMLAASPVIPVGEESVFDEVQDAILAVVGGQETAGSASARAADAIIAALGTKGANHD